MQDYAHYVNSIRLETKQHIKQLQNAKQEYEGLTTKLETFRDKISIDLMVPVANNAQLAFLEGTAVHTNELLVALGSNYFAKMTAKDAIEFCNRKCTVIDQRINEYETQNKMFLERSSCLNSQMFSENEIVEPYNEEQEMVWREKHKEHVKNMKQQEAEERKKMSDKSDDYYFSRLDELELEESLSELNTGS